MFRNKGHLIVEKADIGGLPGNVLLLWEKQIQMDQTDGIYLFPTVEQDNGWHQPPKIVW